MLNDKQEKELISLDSNPYKQNEALLNLFCDEDIKPELFHKFHLFIEALRSTHQSHIAALLWKG